MCLRRRVPHKEKLSFLKRIPAEGRKVHKVVSVEDGKYYPICLGTESPYKEGVNHADASQKICFSHDDGAYDSGFHFFTNKETAKDYLYGITDYFNKHKKSLKRKARENNTVFRSNFKIITCVVKKSWITAMGTDGCNALFAGRAVVAKKAIFPEREK